MQVVMVSVSIRESKGNGEGWKGLELGAQAQVFPGEDWREAQASLYEALKGQLETLGTNGQDANAQEPNGQARNQDSANETGPLCPTHHKAKSGKYGLYCPTRLADGSWCRWRGGK